MAGLIPAPLTLDATDAVMGVHGQGPARGQGLMGTAGLDHQGLLLTGRQAGREQKDLGPTGPDLVPLVASGAGALVYESRLLGSYHLLN